MKRLIIARHGNTFLPDEKPTRIGRYSNLPLVDDTLPRSIGQYLNQRGININKAYAAPLIRTIQTAKLILAEMNSSLEIQPVADFLEIDYGPDENKTEKEVITRLGKQEFVKQGQLSPSIRAIKARGKTIIDNWNSHAKVPDGWLVDSDKIIKTWRQFANKICEGETVLVVSSNGIIRFAPRILPYQDYVDFLHCKSLKVKTGSIAIFDHKNGYWQCNLWNERPAELK